MVLDQNFVGRIYPPSETYEVAREKIREFADALGDPNPVYRDVEAARAHGHPDVIAPPTFPIVLALKAAQAIVADPALGLEYAKVVHGEQSFHYARPIHAGDELQVTAVVDAIRSVGGNDLVTTRADIATTGGEHVVTAFSMLVARGPAGTAS
jgi:acyl dehydratase